MECSAPGGDRTGLAPVSSTILERICHEAAGRFPAAGTRGRGSMNRPITGFRLDDHGDWTALLSCGHAQHVRHTPPFTNRPWVTTASGRDSRLGEPLPCVRCDRFELPERVVAYQHTPVLTERSIPASLRTKHVTASPSSGQSVSIERQRAALVFCPRLRAPARRPLHRFTTVTPWYFVRS